MSKITLTDVTSGYNLSVINTNFKAIEDELNNKILYRNNTAQEDNEMLNDQDMNGLRILNLPEPTSDTEPVRKIDLLSAQTSITDAQTLNSLYEYAIRLAEEAGYTVAGRFDIGCTVTLATQVVWSPTTGVYYTWAGALPKTVTTDSLTTDGISSTTWVDATGTLLRDSSVLSSSLASTSSTVSIAGTTAAVVADNVNYFAAMRAATPIRNFKEIASKRAFNIEEFRVTGQTYWDTAFTNAFDAANTYGNGLEFGSGTFNFSAPQTWKFPTEAGKIVGKGVGKTIIAFPNAASGETELTLTSSNGADWYDLTMEGMSIKSTHNGTTLMIGSSGLADPLNVARFSDIAVANSYATAGSSQAIVLNYVVNSNFIGVRGNCYANGSGTNYGYGLTCNQVEFCNFASGSYGNASYGIRFLGYTYGNVFSAVDVENINIGIYNGSANAGRNTFIGGQFSLWQNYLLQAPVGADRNRIHLINPNISSTTNVIDTSNGLGIRIQGVQWDITAIPTLPATGVTYTNTTGRICLVNIWGGTVSAVSRNGYGMGMTSGSVILRPNDTIAITYSATPSWYWSSLD